MVRWVMRDGEKVLQRQVPVQVTETDDLGNEISYMQDQWQDVPVEEE